MLEETAFMTKGVGLPHFAILPGAGPIRSRLLRERLNIHVLASKIDHADVPNVLERIVELVNI